MNLEGRVAALEAMVMDLKELVEVIQNIATNVAVLAEQLKQQDKRLSAIEESATYRNRQIWSYVIGGLIGAAVAYLTNRAFN